MKRKRYRKGQVVSDFLLFYKEALPHFSNSGKRKRRMAFFECSLHTDHFYLMSINNAKDENRVGCLCDSKFNGENIHKLYTKKEVDEYSFAKKQRWYDLAKKQTPPGWFWVSRMGCFLRQKDGSNLLFYRFEKADRSGADYRTARKIEDITWNRPKPNKAFYLMRMSYELDALHSEGLITFKSDLWNRGSGMEFFQGLLIQNNVI